jgi:hypothetical protein
LLCPPPPQFFYVLYSPCHSEAYKITLLSVYLLNFFIFYAVRVLTKESKRLVLPRISC